MSQKAPRAHRLPASHALRTFSVKSGSNAKTIAKPLGTKGLEDYRQKMKRSIDNRLQRLEKKDREVINAIRDMPNYDGADEDGWAHAEEVLDGRVEIDISHAGGEFQQLMEEDLGAKCVLCLGSLDWHWLEFLGGPKRIVGLEKIES
ncbi:hypothetical protein C0991_004958 [Blastosporella zonata]|nr:hypothetical protein C0991_004958 [Blastosporella zonata]